MIDWTKPITAKQLRRLGACGETVARLCAEWPDGVIVSLEVLRRANELCADISWFARAVLSTQAWADYEAAEAPAWADYEAAEAQSWAAYLAAEAQSWAAYLAARAQSRAAYLAAEAQALWQAILFETASGGEGLSWPAID